MSVINVINFILKSHEDLKSIQFTVMEIILKLLIRP